MDKFGVKEVMDVTFYDLEDGSPKLYLDTLKLSNLENTAEQAMARGGAGNPILITWDYNREANFEIQDALMTPKSLSLLAGTPLVTEATSIHKREVLIVDESLEVELSETPIDEDDDEKTIFVYSTEEEGNTPLVVNSISEKTLSLAYDSQVEEGDEVVVYYQYTSKSSAQIISISSEDFPGYYKIVGDTVVRNARTGKDEKFQIVVERAKIMPDFTMTMEAEGDPSVFDMNIQAYKPLDKTQMVKMIKY